MKIYNTKSRKKEPFRPIDAAGKQVGLYWCGVTVYDSLHLGHGRAAVVPDTLRRYLEYRGYQVRYVTNFTDVDDNIVKRAIREGRHWREVTSTYMDEYGRVTSALGNRPADAHPRATDHIAEMVELAATLVENQSAYVANNGDVYFDVTSFESYGGVSGRKLDDQLEGGSGRIDEEQLAVKKNPGDFIVWKLNQNDPPEFLEHPDLVPGWNSPWGHGRPGWHLECSALSERYLGMPFDIHGGGTDLVFPHHENENAQNCRGYQELLAGREAVNYWMHNGFITVKAETEAERASEYADGDAVKMSKSLGNVKWLREMMWPAGPFDPVAIRLLYLSSHYRSPMTFSVASLEQAASRVAKIYNVLEAVAAGIDDELLPTSREDLGNEELGTAIDSAIESFETGMDDDLNTPAGLAAISELVSIAQREFLDGGVLVRDESQAGARRVVSRSLATLLSVLGLPDARRGGGSDSADDHQGLLNILGGLRQKARVDKDYALSDRIRDELAALGYEVRDRPGGEWEIVRL